MKDKAVNFIMKSVTYGVLLGLMVGVYLMYKYC